MSTLTLTAVGPVRLAMWSDEDGLVECAVMENRENGFAPADADLVRQRIRALLKRDGGMIGVISGSAGIEAAIALVLSRFWSSYEIHMEKLFSYVHEPYRRSSHAKDMITFAKWASTAASLPLLFAEISTQASERKLKLYERQFRAAGSVFVHGTTPPIESESTGVAR